MRREEERKVSDKKRAASPGPEENVRALKGTDIDSRETCYAHGQKGSSGRDEEDAPRARK